MYLLYYVCLSYLLRYLLPPKKFALSDVDAFQECSGRTQARRLNVLIKLEFAFLVHSSQCEHVLVIYFTKTPKTEINTN